jgi:hypothetical protein
VPSRVNDWAEKEVSKEKIKRKCTRNVLGRPGAWRRGKVTAKGMLRDLAEKKETELGTNKAQLELTQRVELRTSNFNQPNLPSLLQLQCSTFNVSSHLHVQQPIFFGSLSFKAGKSKGA